MNNENKSIHEFDIRLICEYFTHVAQQGPGCDQITLRALDFIDNLTDQSHIADLGCGSGRQTMALAAHAPGRITALDLFPDFIDSVLKAELTGIVIQGVDGIISSIDNLPFAEEEFDLIWSEGAIYNIGFRRGLDEWRKYLKQGGYIAVTEVSWFTDERPAEIDDFWMDAYSQIDTVSNKVAQMQHAGYIPVANFILPESCWTEHFYAPQAEAQEKFLKKHAGNKAAEAFIANQRHEMELYLKYNQFYGYVFYIGKKI